MDQELIAYLDRRLGDLDGKIGDLDGKIGDLDGKIGDLDGKIGDLDGKIGGLERRSDRRFKQLRQHVDTQIRETQTMIDTRIRETQIMIEGLRAGQETLAESIVDKKAERDRSEADHERSRQEDRAFCSSLFSDVKGRVDDHEDRISACEARVKKIESAGG